MFGGPIAAVLFVVMKRWMLAGLGVCVSAASVATAIPLYVGETADAHSGSGVLRVMTANLRLGGADAGVLTSLAQSRADVLAVQELTPDASRRLSAGVDAAFPYHVLDERQNASGVGLWNGTPSNPPKRFPAMRWPS